MFFTSSKLASIRAPKKAAPKPAPKKVSVVVKAPEVAKGPVPVKLPEPVIIKLSEPVSSKATKSPVKRKITIKGLKASEPAKSAPISITPSNNKSITLGNKKISLKV